MAKTRILVVEDDPKVVVFVTDQLEYLGYDVAIARNGLEALEKVKEDKPDLVVLDVMMPEMDGYEVCRQLRLAPETRNIPILMLTAKGQIKDKVTGFDRGADDYLPKPYDKAEFEARVRALLKRSASPPFTPAQDHCVLAISCKPEQRITIRASGLVTFSDVTKKVLDVDPAVYARQADETPALSWRFNSKQWGNRLHEQVFVDHPEVVGSYSHALGAVNSEGKLHLRFESKRDFLGVPLEFLYNDMPGGRDYLVLRHPLARLVSGVHVKVAPLSPAFLNDLWERGDSLRVLLVASDTGSIPGVDEEISALTTRLQTLFGDKRISLKIEAIPTEQATYERIRNELEHCKHHIFHYAGHGSYDARSTERSSLLFWEKPNRQGAKKYMPTSELQMLVRGSNLRFVYLSCCLGTKTGKSSQLLDDDFLGIADGVTHAGVPAVLGFRWPVSDSGARTLALAFYESLAKQGQIDIALLDARCRIAGPNRDDITWLSPILIMQA